MLKFERYTIVDVLNIRSASTGSSGCTYITYKDNTREEIPVDYDTFIKKLEDYFKELTVRWL